MIVLHSINLVSQLMESGYNFRKTKFILKTEKIIAADSLSNKSAQIAS